MVMKIPLLYHNLLQLPTSLLASVLLFIGTVQLSPSRMNAVWIVAVYEGKGTTRTVVPTGTSFAVRCPSMNKLITAQHLLTEKIIRRDPVTRREISHNYRLRPAAEYVIIRGMVRSKGIAEVTGTVIIPVKYSCGESKLDWAVLSRTDGIQFSDEDDMTVPICHLADLPEVETEPKVKYIIAIFLHSLILIRDLIYCLFSILLE